MFLIRIILLFLLVITCLIFLSIFPPGCIVGIIAILYLEGVIK